MRHNNRDHKYNSTALLLLAAIVLLNGVSRASARPVSVYTVAKVKLDVRAKNAVLAKKRALTEGPLQALKLMFKRLAPFRAYDRLSSLTLDEADKVIEGFAVRSERNSSTRYLALLDYNFSQKKLQALLLKKGVPFFDRRSGKQVLMPVFRVSDGGPTDLKNKKNWWRAWRTIDLKHGLTDTRLYKPRNSDHDSWQKIIAGDRDQYNLLRKRYAVQKLIMVDASLNPEKDSLSLRIFGEDHVGPLDYTQEMPVTEPLSASYERAAILATGILEGRWREPQIVGDVVAVAPGNDDPDQSAANAQAVSTRMVNETIFLRVAFRGLRDWQQIRKRMQRIPGVQKMKVNSLSPRGADVRISYPGGVNRLQTQLSSYGFAIDQRGEELVLRSIGR